MTRTFAYVRVSTSEQTTENQINEIVGKGFVVEPHRIVSETFSGSTPAVQRPGFQKLLNKLEKGDRLIVSKLDRLGRDAVDVQATLQKLSEMEVDVHCIALAGFDLTTAVGKMMLNVIGAFAQFERDLLIERTKAGLNRAKAQGKTLGRPKSLTDKQKEDIRHALANGDTVSGLARKMKTSRATIMRAANTLN